MRAVLQPGKEYDFLTPQEMHKGLNDMQGRLVDALVREELRGVRTINITRNIDPGNTSIIGSPASGYTWSLMTMGAYYPTGNPTQSQTIYVYIAPPQFSINGGTTSYAQVARFFMFISQSATPYTFSKGQILLDNNVALIVNNPSSSTVTMRFTAQFVEVPAEMVGKLYV